VHQLDAPPNPLLPQKSCPTSFQLFPNVRDVVLVPSQRLRLAGGAVEVEAATDEPDSNPEAAPQQVEVDVLAVFLLPDAPANAAAARAALAGVTRLAVRGGVVESAALAAALASLPGLRAVSLLDCECGPRLWWPGGHPAAALECCPRLESLDWDVWQRHPRGAYGSGAR
jgi:hypothetical protein